MGGGGGIRGDIRTEKRRLAQYYPPQREGQPKMMCCRVLLVNAETFQ